MKSPNHVTSFNLRGIIKDAENCSEWRKKNVFPKGF